MKDKAIHHTLTSGSTQRGQAIVLIALGFVMLLAFTGLVVDVARVFATRGELRRAVDAAGLAATAQFRSGATGDKITHAAYDLVATHGILSSTVSVETCNLVGTAHNDGLCPHAANDPARKLVHVEVTATVPMLFMQLIGINNVQITGDNTSEAASVEAVLVLDNSESQGYDFASLPPAYSTCHQTNVNDTYACMNGGTLSNGTTVLGCNNEPITDAAHLATYPGLTRGICQPFLKTKEAAYAFMKRLYEGYDRVAIVNFNTDATPLLLPLTYNLTAGGGSAIDTLNNMDVYVSKPYADNGLIACNSDTPVADQWKCGSSNIADGLIQANNVYADTSNPPRQDALWVTLLLVDGAANRAPIPENPLQWTDPIYGTCPFSERSTPLKCRDADVNTRHYFNDAGAGFGLYDADDYARDAGDQLGLDPAKYTTPLGGKPDGVLIYTISLGRNSVCSNGDYTAPAGTTPATCTNYNSAFGDPDAAEQLLRYVADIGDDGDMTTGPCLGPKGITPATWGLPTAPLGFTGRGSKLGLQCGNYYFAPDATELERIFLEIAGRIFTRISG